MGGERGHQNRHYEGERVQKFRNVPYLIVSHPQEPGLGLESERLIKICAFIRILTRLFPYEM